MGIELDPGEGYDLVLAPGATDHIGEIQAWSLDGAPAKRWTKTFKSQNWGPLLVTGGNVLFGGGTNDRFFRAFDATTGALLWQQRTSSGVIGVPTTYEVDGVQYVAVLSGWGVDAEREQAAAEHADRRRPSACRRAACSGCSRCESSRSARRAGERARLSRRGGTCGDSSRARFWPQRAGSRRESGRAIGASC